MYFLPTALELWPFAEPFWGKSRVVAKEGFESFSVLVIVNRLVYVEKAFSQALSVEYQWLIT